MITREKLLEAALWGCDWLTDVGQVMEKDDPYFGAIRGEYNTKIGEWSFYGPFWHTGQAARTLLMAFKMTGNKKYLKHLSFDFCTLAVGCAVIMWTDLWKSSKKKGIWRPSRGG